MSNAFAYQALYDELRRHGYHEYEDHSSHLAPYIAWIKQHAPYQTALDIGCSAGKSLELLEGEGQQICGVDVSAVAVSKGQALGRNVVQASATSLPFPDRSFDLVASADVFEHLHEDDAPAAAREAIRVAREFIFMKIASQVDMGQPWKTIAGHPLHLTLQPLSWWKAFFSEAGEFIREEEHVFCLKLHEAPTRIRAGGDDRKSGG